MTREELHLADKTQRILVRVPTWKFVDYVRGCAVDGAKIIEFWYDTKNGYWTPWHGNERTTSTGDLVDRVHILEWWPMPEEMKE